MQFFKLLFQSVIVKVILALAAAFLAIAGLSSEEIARFVVGWWISDPSGFALNVARLACLAVAVLIIALLISPLIKRRFFPSPHVKDIFVAAGITPQTTSPVLLLCTAASSVSRLKIVVEHSRYFTSVSRAGWTTPRLVVLADLKDLVAGHQITQSVVSCNHNGSELWWGNQPDIPGNKIEVFQKYRAKIRFIVDNDEQIYRFGLRRTDSADPSFLAWVFTEKDLDF